ncbi:MAG: hypothetical protein R3B38_03015 [Patescibacteria group bacterium]
MSSVSEADASQSTLLSAVRPGSDFNIRELVDDVLLNNKRVGIILWSSAPKTVLNDVVKKVPVKITVYEIKKTKSMRTLPTCDVWIIENGVDHASVANIEDVIKLSTSQLKNFLRSLRRIHERRESSDEPQKLHVPTQNELMEWMSAQVENLLGFHRDEAYSYFDDEAKEHFKIPTARLFDAAFSKFWDKHGQSIRVGEPLQFMDELLVSAGPLLAPEICDGLKRVTERLLQIEQIEEDAKQHQAEIELLKAEIKVLQEKLDKQVKHNQRIVGKVQKELQNIN